MPERGQGRRIMREDHRACVLLPDQLRVIGGKPDFDLIHHPPPH